MSDFATAGTTDLLTDDFGDALDDVILQLRRDSSPPPNMFITVDATSNNTNNNNNSKPPIAPSSSSQQRKVPSSLTSSLIIRHPKTRRNSAEHTTVSSRSLAMHDVPLINLPVREEPTEGPSTSRSVKDGSSSAQRDSHVPGRSLSPHARSLKKFTVTVESPSPLEDDVPYTKEQTLTSQGSSTPRGLSPNPISLRKTPSSDTNSRVTKAIAMHKDRVMRSYLSHAHTPLKIKQKAPTSKKSTGRKATRLNIQQSQSIRAQLSVMSLQQLRLAELNKKDAVSNASGYVRNPYKQSKEGSTTPRQRSTKAGYDDESGKIDSSVLSLADFTVLRTLGHGTYGVVKLVRYKGNNGLFALKILEKRQQIEEEEVDHVMTESKMLKMLKFPFIVKHSGSFQDEWQLYILMEYVTGSDLFAYMQEYRFNEYTVKFFAAQIILTLEYLHSLNIVFRDLKPENLLVDWKGYLKLTDFSFAKSIRNTRTSTFCGTPCYIAPEIILQEGHGLCVDWWALGILIFEMIQGHPPFDNENVVELYDAILTVNPVLSNDKFSDDCADLVRGLLTKDPEMRLGAKGPHEVKEHPFFDDFDWDGVMHRTVGSPLPTHMIEAVSAGNNPEPDKPRCGRPLSPEEQKLFEGF